MDARRRRRIQSHGLRLERHCVEDRLRGENWRCAGPRGPGQLDGRESFCVLQRRASSRRIWEYPEEEGSASSLEFVDATFRCVTDFGSTLRNVRLLVSGFNLRIPYSLLKPQSRRSL